MLLIMTDAQEGIWWYEYKLRESMSDICHLKYTKALPDIPDNESVKLVTKDLEPGRLFYEISTTDRLVRDNEDGTYTDMNFTGQLYVFAEQRGNGYFMVFNEAGFLSEVNVVPYYALYCSDLSTPWESRKPQLK